MEKYIVFTLDCINSKKVENVTGVLEEKVSKLNKDPLRNYDFITPFSVLKGDEIQGVIKYSYNFLKVIRYLREAFYPIKVRIGIGIGYIDNHQELDERNSWELNGTAFHNARKGLEYLSNHHLFGEKPFSQIVSDTPDLDSFLNPQLKLYDTILSGWSEKTYEAIHLREQFGSFRKLDGYNNLTFSAYTKRANAGHWAVIESFEEDISFEIAKLI